MRIGRTVVSGFVGRSRPARAGLAVAVVAVVASSVVLPAGAQAPGAAPEYTPMPQTASADPGLIAGMPSAVEAQARDRERRARRATSAEREARLLSRTQFRGRGRSAALQTARSGFGSLVDQPAWQPPALRSGETIVGYAGDHLTKIKLPDSTKHAVVFTSHPARVRDDHGVMRPFDLTLQERADSFVTANAAIDVRLPKRLSDAITLGDTGVSVSVPTSSATSTATQVVGKAFWSDVDTDVDLLVAPIPEGFETTHILRSAQAPERLALTIKLPSGSQLRYTPARTPAPFMGSIGSAEQRGIEVVKDGRVIARIAAPSSVDADGEQVPTRLELDGDRVTLVVEHQAGDFKYPIAADPVYTSYVLDDSNWDDSYDSFDGWSYAAAPANTFGAWARNNQFGNGVIIEANPNAPYCCSYYGHWFFFAPGTSYLYRADLNVIHHIASNSQYFTGIANNSGWQTSWYTTAPQSNSSRTMCVAADCGTGGATPGNRFSMGIQMTGPTGPTGAKAYLGRAALYLSDNDTPTVTSVTHSQPMSSWHSGGTITTTVNGNDPGLGIDYAAIHEEHDPNNISAVGLVHTTQGICGDRDNRCPNNVSVPIPLNLDQLSEGIHRLHGHVHDVVDHLSSRSTEWNLKIDRSAPSFDTAQGSLWESRDHALTEKTYSVSILARDGDSSTAALSRSGVRSVDFVLKRPDGSVAQAAPDLSPQDCASGNCTKPRTWELDTDSVEDGTYTVFAYAKDQLGHAASSSWSITVDRRPPAPTEIELEAFDDDHGSATIGWNTDDDPAGPNPAQGSEVRYRLASGDWSAWQEAQSDLIQIAGMATNAVIELQVRAVNEAGVVSSAVAETVTTGVFDADSHDFPAGDSVGANAEITVELRATDGTLVPVGGLPITATDATGARTTMLSREDGVAYFHGLSPGEYTVVPAQAGGVSPTTSDHFTVVAEQRTEHHMVLEIDEPPAATSARLQVPSGVNDLLACIDDLGIPLKVCSQFLGDALRATFVTNVLFATDSQGPYGGVPDDTRANAFRHSYAVSRFVRTMLTTFKDDGPVTWAYQFARAHELEDRESPFVDVRRSSFMDTNNNLVAYNYATAHPTRNGTQLCSTMRTKSKHARLAHYFDSSTDEIPVPPDNERTRLIYNLPFNPDVAGTGNPDDPGIFPESKPCKYALARYDQGYEGG